MSCEFVRESLSARLDGEAMVHAPEQLRDHLRDCATCRAWQEAAHLVTRRVRLTAAPEVSDRTEEILTAVLADRAGARDGRQTRRRGRTRRFARAGLTATALAQFVVILPAIVGHAGTGVPVHAARELGAFNLALAAGFLAAALWPVLARGVIPVAGTATAALLVVAAVDCSIGQADLIAESPHLIALAGWLFLHVLAWAARSDDDRPGTAGARGPGARRSPGPDAGAPARARLWRPAAPANPSGAAGRREAA